MDRTLKTAAPFSSAGTDVEQPPMQICKSSIAENGAERKPQSSLRTITIAELYDTAYKAPAPIIDNLLYAGTYLFVGAPKVGKSFFMAQLAYHVSNGLSLWDYRVHQGTVLYLALEDDFARLQKRLARMYGTEGNELLHFAIESKQLSDGLEEQLEEFIRLHPATRLIIIDTLQKVRELGGEKFSYASDYEIVTRLKRFSDKHYVCLLVVHHTRKQGTEDCFDTISGTNGLMGAADGAFILQKEKRTDNKAVLDVVGRDQQDQRMLLTFDRERCIWQLTKLETELWKDPPDPVLEAVVQLVTDSTPEWTGTASELAALLGELELKPNALSRRLNVGVNRLLDEYSVAYECNRTHTGRQIRLVLTPPFPLGERNALLIYS